jgi:energy-converting hydrogenase Eha subunit A
MSGPVEHSVLDLPALAIAIAITLLVAGVLIVAHREDNKRRGWLAAAALAAGLITVGLLDLLSREPRDTHVAAVILGAVFPVLGTVGTIRGTRRISRPWLRWIVVVVATFTLLFVGLLVGATVVPRFLP